MASADARNRRIDVLVAVGTAVLSIALLVSLPTLDRMGAGSGETPTVFPPALGPDWLILAVGVLAQSAALRFARRAPRIVLIAVTALSVPVAALSLSSVLGLMSLPVVVAVVLAVLRVPLAKLWPSILGPAALVVVAETFIEFRWYGAGRGGFAQGLSAGLSQGVLQAVGSVGLPLIVALLVRSRREVRAARRGEASAVDRERDAVVDAAVARERTSMARELHDIAAHHLSGIALMAAVIDRQIDTDPTQAHEGARQVRAQSTAVLDDLRRLVGLLRDDGPAQQSVETLAGIVDLVERARIRSDVRLDVVTGAEDQGAGYDGCGDNGGDGTAGTRGIGEGVGPLAQLAAYRTVQEALANAALHAPRAPCTVTIDDREPRQVVVSVANGPGGSGLQGSSAPGGNGLKGMRERADLVGAHLAVGPTTDGGWRVELALGRERNA